MNKDAEVVKEEITYMLNLFISFHDYYENFYHGFLAGILYGMGDYVVKSNRESGNGRTDLWMKPVSIFQPAYLFEFKIAKKADKMVEEAENALQQIYDKKYDSELVNAGYQTIVRYGVSFFGKDCYVAVR